MSSAVRSSHRSPRTGLWGTVEGVFFEEGARMGRRFFRGRVTRPLGGRGGRSVSAHARPTPAAGRRLQQFGSPSEQRERAPACCCGRCAADGAGPFLTGHEGCPAAPSRASLVTGQQGRLGRGGQHTGRSATPPSAPVGTPIGEGCLRRARGRGRAGRTVRVRGAVGCSGPASRPLKGNRPTVFQETPVYDRLVAERGDVPVQVRGEADRIRRELAHVLHRTAANPPSAPRSAFEPRTPPHAL